ncbi:hypothetical protein VOLCADRAFT_107631 [Volvox carteri f. nagariensis]|uniref:Endonuclease/exonuclease/phosphatase domain-containing protein n=1 Tax=Volvox carteri f. nagariensis TaxID=3068 RepID=D8UFB2_VOLCA|nr:uncharacterized protein VOLCADRAFT_107631 [Volvox carteri f. nagariensis]EFJ41576.1 hypothetical protein VOLCADRAFT_107631 [Volvox carteri f. nagariensis]|eukprot:XP_002957367.1 hypothetical protein VOLCADRAFT_107631 [Volvox carteri f. nagariensis]
MALTGQIKVLTFNTWGLPLASKDDKLRLRNQADYFRQTGKDLDVVLLQEVWSEEYVALLADAAAAAGLAHVTTFDGGMLGAGLMVMSRFPIIDVVFHPYSVRGEPGALQGEAMAGKGIGYARVQLPHGSGSTAAHIFNTHTHANWVHSVAIDTCLSDVKVPTDSFAPYRVANIVDAISFMRPVVEAAMAAGELVLAGGDWNVPADSLEATLIQELLPGLRDAWQLAGHATLDPRGNTCGDPSNVYTGSIIGGYVPERIDLVWTNSSKVSSCETVLKVMPGTNLNYSDHYGVLVTASCEVSRLKPRPTALAPAVAAAATSATTITASTLLTSTLQAGAAQGEEGNDGSPGPALGCWADPQSDSNVCDRRTTRGAGPVAESKVSPDSRGGGGGSCDGEARKVNRRARLLQLALEQLRTGLTACSACQARLRLRALLLAAVALAAIAVQLYCVVAETDHWARRLAGVLAVVVAPVALALCLCQPVWMLMNKAVCRGLGQLVRMVEMWEKAARAEGVSE